MNKNSIIHSIEILSKKHIRLIGENAIYDVFGSIQVLAAQLTVNIQLSSASIQTQIFSLDLLNLEDIRRFSILFADQLNISPTLIEKDLGLLSHLLINHVNSNSVKDSMVKYSIAKVTVQKSYADIQDSQVKSFLEQLAEIEVTYYIETNSQ